MAMYPCLSLPSLSFPTLTGSIVTFNSQYAGLPLKSHVVDVDYTGSAISNCFVVNMADVTNISSFQGLLNGTYGFVDLGSLNGWAYESAYKYFWTTDLVLNHNAKMGGNLLCPLYHMPTNYSEFSDVTKDMIIGVAFHSHNNALNIRNLAYTDAQTFTTAMNGVYLIYELKTPTTPTITEAQFNTLLSAFNISGEAFKIPFNTPIYGGQYDCLTGIVTSNKDSGGGDITPTYQQTATANCETSLGENNIWADTGDTTLQYIKLG